MITRNSDQMLEKRVLNISIVVNEFFGSGQSFVMFIDNYLKRAIFFVIRDFFQCSVNDLWDGKKGDLVV